MKGLLLVNLGSPQKPTVSAIRTYLREFLMDPYVLQMPFLLRAVLVYGFILPFRPKKTLHNYLSIWTDQGSPLIALSSKLKEKLQRAFSENKQDIHVEIAMRYGKPSLQNSLQVFKSKNIQKIKVIPLYPQYALSSSYTVSQKLRELNKNNFSSYFDFQIVKDFYNDPKFIQPLIEVTTKHLQKLNYDHLLISFHGLPKDHLGEKIGSPICNYEDCCNSISEKNRYCYRAQCFETARLLANGLNLSPDKWSVAFQSRLTKGWIEPFTDKVIENFPKRGIKNLAIVCPSFVTDCLETLEEIEKTEKNRFLKAGGENFYYVSCLNDTDSWVDSLRRF